MASSRNVLAFQQISPAMVYNIINQRRSRLVFLDMRLYKPIPFPCAVLPSTGHPDNSSDFCVILSCLRAQLSENQSVHRGIVLFIEEHRVSAIEKEMAAHLLDSEVFSLLTEWNKFCCFRIDQLFQMVPLQFISAALSADTAPKRVPSLIECLLPRKLFICERKLVRQALNPISGLGITCVLNVTTNLPVDRPEITHSFPIEDSIECDIAAVCRQTRPLLKELLDKKESVLVHCAAGVSRSGSVVIDFVMHALHLDFHAAKALVQQSRPEVKPNAAFERQLDKCPRWGLISMDILDKSIAMLQFQAGRGALRVLQGRPFDPAVVVGLTVSYLQEQGCTSEERTTRLVVLGLIPAIRNALQGHKLKGILESRPDLFALVGELGLVAVYTSSSTGSDVSGVDASASHVLEGQLFNPAAVVGAGLPG